MSFVSNNVPLTLKFILRVRDTWDVSGPRGARASPLWRAVIALTLPRWTTVCIDSTPVGSWSMSCFRAEVLRFRGHLPPEAGSFQVWVRILRRDQDTFSVWCREKGTEETCLGWKRSHSLGCVFLPIQVTEKADCYLDYHTSEAEV